MTSPIYRLATIADIDKLLPLRLGMQQEVNEVSDQDVPPEYLDNVRSYFAHAMNEGKYASSVAEINGKLIAAAGLVIYEKPPSLKGKNGRNGYITNVYTLPEHRGQGHAAELLKLLIQHARQNNVDNLGLGATEMGKGVYERVGFKPTRHVALEMRL